ncbi:MAG: class I SAM-dependent rRNA methyltransferase [Bdellovibrionales bacterium]
MPKQSSFHSALEHAWNWRQEAQLVSSAYRLFHGPGEAKGSLSQIIIESFTDQKTHYWITDFSLPTDQNFLSEVTEFLKQKGAESVTLLSRSQPGQAPAPPSALFGSPPEEIHVQENDMTFAIRFQSARHPGLFLDHAPLRQWLKLNTPRGARVLNTFCYTGSLSIAAKYGGAESVLNLDLSPSYLRWSQKNWELNSFSNSQLKCMAEDTLQYLPRLAKQEEKFDVVILDPPSFARNKKSTFSTKKDLPLLHKMALDVLAPGGLLITSINSESVSKDHYLKQVREAFREKNRKFSILKEIEQPQTFATPNLQAHSSLEEIHRLRYLKGWILKDLQV